jgi:hypothetical protein
MISRLTPRPVAVELEEKAAQKANSIEVVLVEVEELKCVLDLTRRLASPQRGIIRKGNHRPSKVVWEK